MGPCLEDNHAERLEPDRGHNKSQSAFPQRTLLAMRNKPDEVHILERVIGAVSLQSGFLRAGSGDQQAPRSFAEPLPRF